jgi:DNA topoisomerase VI subunit B
VGVFISIVSTKVPFKGTGKEYIGDDIEEIQRAVKHCIQQCCVQLRSKLLKRNALKEQNQRKKNLTKYIPDVSNAFVGILTSMQSRLDAANSGGTTSSKRQRTNSDHLEYLSKNKVSVATLSERLTHTVEKREELSSEQGDLAQCGAPQVMFFVPMVVRERAFEPDIHHPACVFRLLTACKS